MSSFGQLIAGAGRVGQGMDAARQRSQALEESELRLMEMRRAEETARRNEEARRQAAGLGSTVKPTFGGLNLPQVERMGTLEITKQPAQLQPGQIPSRDVPPNKPAGVDIAKYTMTPDVTQLMTKPEPTPTKPEAPQQPIMMAGVNDGKEDPIESVATTRPKSYTADPNKYTPVLEQGISNRDYLYNLAQIYRQQGFPDKAFSIESQVQQLDTTLYKLSLDQAMAEFANGGDPTRALGLFQRFTNNTANIQPRSDGLFNLYMNGQLDEEGVTFSDINDKISTYVDNAYQQRKLTMQAERAQAGYETSLEIQKELAKENAQMIREAYIAKIQGQNSLAEAALNNAGLFVTNMGEGKALVTAKDGSFISVVDVYSGTETVDGVEIPTAPTGQLVDFPDMR